jgi:hypothetical protein
VAAEKGDSAAAAEVMMKIYELYIFGARAITRFVWIRCLLHF